MYHTNSAEGMGRGITCTTHSAEGKGGGGGIIPTTQCYSKGRCRGICTTQTVQKTWVKAGVLYVPHSVEGSGGGMSVRTTQTV